LPPRLKPDELREFFSTYYATLEKKQNTKNPIRDVEVFENGAYMTVEFANQDISRTCLSLDNTDWQGYKIKVFLYF